MPKFRKKPLVVEAVQWTGSNYDEIMEFAGGGSGNIVDQRGRHLVIHTREGKMTADVSDWVVKEPNPTADRKFYPVKDEIFKTIYDRIPEKCTACGVNEPSNLIPAEPHFLCKTCATHP